MAQIEPDHRTEIIDELIDRLATGESLLSIGRDPNMPCARTITRWSNASDELAARILEAREVGYLLRAEQAVADAKCAKDPVAGRLAFDAERWHLSHLANAFRDRPVQVDVRAVVANDDTFAAVAAALDRAAGTIAGGGDSTKLVASESSPGPTDAGG